MPDQYAMHKNRFLNCTEIILIHRTRFLGQDNVDKKNVSFTGVQGVPEESSYFCLCHFFHLYVVKFKK